jgi:hypothetical protein
VSRVVPIAAGAYVGTFGSGPLVVLTLILCGSVMAFAAAFSHAKESRNG